MRQDRWRVAAAALALLLAGPRPALAADSVPVRAGLHEGYSRLVFDWTSRVDYKLTPGPDGVEISFDHDAVLDLARVRPGGLPQIIGVEQLGQTPARLLVKVPPGARLEAFRLGEKLVVDIHAPAAAPKAPPEAAKPERAKPEPAKPVAAKPAPVAEPPPAREVAPDQPAAPLSAEIDLSIAEGARLAVFERHGFLWLVADRPLAELLPVAGGPGAGLLGEARRQALEQGGAISWRLPEGAGVAIGRTDRSWRLTLGPRPDSGPPATAIGLTRQDGKVALRVGLPGAGEALTLTDPQSGDRLLVVPTAEPGQALALRRRLPEFEIMPALQGMVLRPLADDLTTRANAEGVTITTGEGLLVADPPRATAGGGDARITSYEHLFDLDAWRRGAINQYDANRRAFERRLGQLEGKALAAARVDYARFLFAHGLAPEALGLLRLAAEGDPDLARSPPVRALEGAAHAYAGHVEEAMKILSAPPLNVQAEAALWRGYALARNGRWADAHKQFTLAGPLPLDYDMPYLGPVGLAVTEAALAAGDTVRAHAMIDRLVEATRENQPRGRGIDKVRVALFKAQLAKAEGDLDEARALWDQLKGSRDDEVAARAQLEILDMDLASGALDKPAAIEALDRLRFAWRGNNYELSVLHRLGRLYFDSGQYRLGFDTLQRAERLFSGTDAARQINDEMKAMFHRLFLEGGADALPPLEALALHRDFAGLTGQGPDGDRIVRRLAERLVSIDLLPEAAELLEHQVNARLEGEDRARVAARLAAIRLLDNKPDLALKVLQVTNMPGLPAELVEARRLLMARAHYQAGRADAALELLKADSSDSARRLAADITWAAGDWAGAANVLAQLTAGFAQDKTPDEDEALLLLRRAVALYLAEDEAQLAALGRQWADVMDGTSQAQAFRLITRPGGLGAGSDFAEIQSRLKEVDLFRRVLDSYRKPDGGA